MIRDSWNTRLVGHTDLGGKGDGMHVNVVDGYAYVGHMGHYDVGTSVVDVSDPAHPRLVTRIPRPAGTHSHKVQVVGDVLLANYERNHWEKTPATAWTAGLVIYDISKRTEPRQIAFFETPGHGVHRMTYWEPPYAYLTGTDTGYLGQFLIIVDLSDPSAPREVGRWWYPGQHAAADEPLTWVPTSGRRNGQEKRIQLHHALVRGDRAYCGWWDAGLVILDLSDRSAPALVSQLDFGPASTATHTALPLPGRDLVVTTDEQLVDGPGAPRTRARIVDVSDEAHPEVLSLIPEPAGDYAERGGRFGPHNLHEMRPGTLMDPNTIYMTYFNAGLRIYDLHDAANPVEVGFIVPEAPPGQASIQLNDLVVTADGLIYVTDRVRGGLYVVERTG